MVALPVLATAHNVCANRAFALTAASTSWPALAAANLVLARPMDLAAATVRDAAVPNANARCALLRKKTVTAITRAVAAERGRAPATPRIALAATALAQTVVKTRRSARARAVRAAATVPTAPAKTARVPHASTPKPLAVVMRRSPVYPSTSVKYWANCTTRWGPATQLFR